MADISGIASLADSAGRLPPAPARNSRWRRFTLGWLALAALARPAAEDPVRPAPPLLVAALAQFRSDVPKGWTYLQTTTAEGQSLVERHDGARPEFDRWSLVRRNDREPTPEERRDYLETRSRRSRAGPPPRLAEQIDAGSAELRHEDAGRVTYECRVRPGDPGDRTAAFLRALVVVHRASGTIETLELRSTGPFRPTFGIRIEEMLTRLSFSLPEGDIPTLPRRVETRLRGTAFWFKSLDATMTIDFGDFARVTRRR